jgi:hypothetical protein
MYFGGKCMELAMITLRDISHTWKENYNIFAYLKHLRFSNQTQKQKVYLQEERDTQRKERENQKEIGGEYKQIILHMQISQ